MDFSKVLANVGNSHFVGVVIVAAERHKKETELYLWMLPHVYCYKVFKFSNGVAYSILQPLKRKYRICILFD